MDKEKALANLREAASKVVEANNVLNQALENLGATLEVEEQSEFTNIASQLQGALLTVNIAMRKIVIS